MPKPDRPKTIRARARWRLEGLEPRILLSADPITASFAESFAPPGSDDSHAADDGGRDAAESLGRFAGDPPTPASPDADTARTPLDLSWLRGSSADASGDSADPDAEPPALPAFDDGSDLRRELVFVDPRTPEYETLLDGLASDPDRDLVVVMLDAERDGVAQIAEALAGYRGIDAIHLVSHGSGDGVQLGDTWLDGEALAASTDAIAGWGASLDPDADILVYGCDLASTAQGRALVASLADLSGADVAASDDPTGNAAAGGDWTLEYERGHVETAVAFDPEARDAWSGQLGAAPTTGELLVNQSAAAYEQLVTGAGPNAVAADASGNFVVVWESDGQDGDGLGIYARQFNADGTPADDEFLVNDVVTTKDQLNPAVSMNASGAFVVVWETDEGSDADGLGIYARLFDSSGNEVKGEFLVNAGAANEADDQAAPAVAMRDDGTFVVAWSSLDQDGDKEGIFAQRFDAAGDAAGGVFQVNETTVKEQYEPAISTNASGDFVVSWTSKDNGTGDLDIYGRRYDASGAALGGAFKVNQSLGLDHQFSSVALDDDRGFVVAWQTKHQDGDGEGIFARRFDRYGDALDDEFQISASGTGDQTVPSVSVDANGNFAVAWTTDGTDIHVREFDALGNPVTGDTQVNVSTGDQAGVSVAMTGPGRYAVVWSGEGAGDADGVFARLYASPLLPSVDANGAAAGVDHAVSFTEGGAAVAIAPGALLGDLDSAVLDSVSVVINNRLDGADEILAADTSGTSLVANYANGILTLSAGTAQPIADFEQVLQTVTYENTSLGPDVTPRTLTVLAADETLLHGTTAEITVTINAVNTTPTHIVPGAQFVDEDTTLVFSNDNGNLIAVDEPDSKESAIQVTLTATNGTVTVPTTIGDEFQVNTSTGKDQAAPAVAVNSSGRYVVAWQSDNGGTLKDDIYVRVYNADGTAATGEITVESADELHTAPVVAINDDGRFVVVWEFKDANAAKTWDIYASVFDADGTELTGNKRLNATTADEQRAPAVAIDSDGNFVVAWQSKGQDASQEGVYVRAFDLGVNALTGEILVNTEEADAQTAPSITMKADGAFVVAWQSSAQDGSGEGVYAQRFNADYSALGTEIAVNVTTTADDQQAPSVAMNDAGDVVVSWQSTGQDDPDGLEGIYAQRIDFATGALVGGEVAVNTTTPGAQSAPAVAIAADGSFSVAWQSTGQDNADGLSGVYLREFDAGGNPLRGEKLVNTATLDDQAAPAIALRGESQAVVVWESNEQDGDKYGVFAQRMLRPGAIDFSPGDGIGDTAVTMVGKVADINAALDGLIFDPDPEFNTPFGGLAEIRIDTDDLGNTGAGGPLTDSDTIVITVNAVNDAPTLAVPAAQVIDQDFPLEFSVANGTAITVGDSDAAETAPEVVQITATVLQGTVTIDLATGVTVTGGANGSAAVTFEGTVAELNDALDGLVYVSTFEYVGPDTLTVDVDDLGNTGAGGNLITSNTVAITVNDFNDAPINVAPAAVSTPENTQFVFSGGDVIAITDEDAGTDDIEVTVRVRHGTLTLATIPGGLSFTDGDGTADRSMTFKGQLSEVNPALDGLKYTPDTQYAGPDTLEIVSNDLGNNPSVAKLDLDLVDITVTPDATNDAPIVNVPGAQATSEEVAVVFSAANGNGISVNDDAAGNPIEVTLTATGGTVTLASSAGTEFQVNSQVTGDQRAAQVGMAPNGDYVVVWQSNGQDGDGFGVFAQRYDASGAVLGAEFLVNTTTAKDQSEPVVAVADGGSFVVAWTSEDQDGNAEGIFAQRYAADGTTLGGEFLVNTTTAKAQKAPAIATDSAGRFVVVWQSDDQDGDDWGAYGQVFDATGAKVGSEFRANFATAKDQIAPAVAMDADGDIVVAWQSKDQDGSDWGVFARRFDSSGAAKDAADIPVANVTFKAQQAPAVAMDDAGNFVVAWESKDLDYPDDKFGIFARAFDADGTAPAAQFGVNTAVADQQRAPSITMEGSGEFLIAWEAKKQDDPDGSLGIFAQRFEADGTRRDGEFRVNTETTKGQSGAAIAAGNDGRFVAVWTSDAQDGNGDGVFGQRYKDIRELTFVIGDGIDDATVTFRGAQDQLNDALDGLVFTPAKDFDGVGQLSLSVDDLGNSGAGGNQVSSADIDINVAAVNDAPVVVVPGAQSVTEDTALVFTAGGGNPVQITDIDAGAGTIEVTLRASVGNLSLSGTTNLTFSDGDGTADAGMTFSGKLTDVNAALEGLVFTAPAEYTGAATLQVLVDDRGNTGTGGDLTDAATIAIDVDPDATNDAPVVNVPGPRRTDEDVALVIGSSTGVTTLISDDADGATVEVTLTVTNGTVTLTESSGPERQINTEVTDEQRFPAISTRPGGESVIAWQGKNQDGSGEGIYAQMLDAAGVPVGPEIPVNSTAASDQTDPAVAANASGTFVVAWVSDGQDGDGKGVFAQRFDATGAKLGGEFRVNDGIAGNQVTPAVAIDDSGAFVVAWQGNDAAGKGILAQRFDANGVAQGGEFVVNSTSAGDQLTPAVAMDSDGDFVIAWQGSDASGKGVFARGFDASGTETIAEFLVNTGATANDQKSPSVAMDADGDFVIAWQGRDTAGDGVFAKLYDAAGGVDKADFLVNTVEADNQTVPTVAMNGSGEFVVAWQGKDAGGQGVFAQRFDASGNAIDDELLVNITESADQTTPAVGIDANGIATVAWTGDNQDGGAEGVFAQRLLLGDALTYTTGDGVDDALIVVRGALADINAALDNLVFTPDSGFTGLASIAIKADDLGNTGAGGALVTTNQLDIVVGDGPSVDLDADDSTGATGAALTAEYVPGGGPIAIADVDALVDAPNAGGTMSVTVTLTNPPDGLLELLDADVSGHPTILKIFTPGTAATTATLSLSGTGTVADFADVLRSVTYDNLAGVPDNAPRAIGFVVNDGSDDSNVAVATVTIFDVPPVFTASGPFAIDENPAGGATVGDVDATDGNGGATDAGITYSIVSNADPDGDLTNAVLINSATGVLTVNDIGDFDFENATTFDVTVRADEGTKFTDKVITVNVSDVDEDPVFTVSGAFAIAENPAGGATVGDVDANDGDGGAADAGITYSIVSNASPDGDGDDAVTINATSGVLTVNDTGDFDFENATTFDVTVRAFDGANTTDQVVTVNISNANDSPVLDDSIAPGAATIFVDGAGPVVVDPGMVVDDEDGLDFAGGTLTVQFSAGNDAGDVLSVRNEGTAAGEVSVLGSTVRFNFGVGAVDVGTFTGGTDATGPLVVTFNAAADEAAVQAVARNVTYDNVSAVPAENERTVRFTLTDGDGGTSNTESVDVEFVTDHVLWFSAKGSESPSDALGGSQNWLSGDVVEFGGGASLETGPATTTSGTFSNQFSFDGVNQTTSDPEQADLRALHYVSTALTLGTGGDTYDLKPGDVIAAIDNGDTIRLTSSDASFIDVTRRDVFVFTPDIAGDYSAGTFTLLLDNPFGKNIHAITLVERTVHLGAPEAAGANQLQAGDFLVSYSGGGDHDDVFKFTPTKVATATDAGTPTLMLDGSQLGFTDQVQGLDLVEVDLDLGDTTLSKRQLLMSLDKANTVGTNNLSVTAHDVFVLDITGTEASGPGNTAATATLLFDGSSVALGDGTATEQSNETIDGFTLARLGTAGVDVVPTLDLDADDSVTVGNGFKVIFTEGDAARAIADTDVDLVDVDSTAFANVKLSVAGLLDGDAEEIVLDSTTFQLATDVAGQNTASLYTVTVTTGAGTADLTITKQGGGTFTEAETETLIKAITYRHADGDNPTDGDRTVDVTVNDGTTDSAAARATINVDPANDAPALDLDVSGAGTGFSLTFNEGDGVTAIADTDADLVDVDSTTFANVKLSVAGLLDGNAETLVLDGDTFALATAIGSQNTSGGLYTVTVTTGAGTADLTITKQGGGPFTEAETETLIKAVQYRHADGDNPSDGDRTVDVTVNDGTTDSAAARATIDVDPANDAPTLDLAVSGAGTGFSLTFNEGDTAKAIADSDADLVDVDSTAFANVKLSVAGLLDGDAEEIVLDSTTFQLATDVAGQNTASLYTVTVTTGAGTADLTITKQGGGPFTEAETETLIKAVQYRHADGDNPSDGDRTVDVTVNDGTTDSAAARATIDVDPANDAPTLDLDASGAGTGFSLTFNEGDGVTAIADTDADLVDVDSTTFANVKLSVAGLLDGNAETLVLDGDTFALATAIGSQNTSGGLYTVTVTTGAGTADLTITKQGGGTFTEAETETLIKAVQYRHADGDNPSDGDRTVDVTVNDGTTDSAAARATIDVDPANDAPTLDLDASGAGTGFSLTFNEGDGVTAIADTDADLVDVDSTAFANVKISVAGLLDGDAEEIVLDSTTFQLATDVAGQNTASLYTVTVTTGAGTADLTITKQGGGTFTEAETETLIKAVQYRHADGDNPTDGDRTVDVTVNDGTTDSAAARATINVDPANDAPALDLDVSGAGTGFSLTFNEGDGVTAIADTDADLVDVDSTTFANVKLSVAGLLDGNAETLVLDGDTFALATAIGSQNTSGGLYTVTVTTGAGTADLTITKQGGGTFTEAETETLIKAVQYRHADGDNPSDGDRTVDVTVNDGTTDSAAARATIDVDPANDAPALDLDASGAGTGFSLTFNEGDGVTAIADTDADLVDVDSTAFANVKISVAGLLDGDAEEIVLDSTTFQLATDVAGQNTASLYTVTVTTGAGTADLTITKQGGGTFTEAETETLIKAVQYRHADGDNPSDGDRTVDVTVNDGTADSAAARATIDVDPANDAPTLDLDASGAGTGFALTFNEGDTAKVIADTDADLVDADSTAFANVKLSVAGLLDGNAEEIVLDGTTFQLATPVAGQNTATLYTVTVTTGAGTADLTITKQGGGPFTEAETETLIKAVQYRHADTDNPSDGDRTVDVTVNDGTSDSAAASATIDVDSANDAPTLDLDASGAGTGFALTFNEGDTAKAIADTDADLVDVDSTSFANVKLSVAGLLDGNAEEIVLDGTTFQLATANAGQVTAGGNYLVAVSTGAGTADLTISHSGGISFTEAETEALVKAITYRHADGDNPTDGDRTVDVTVNDGTADSLAARTTIDVEPLEAAPVFTASGPFAIAENPAGGATVGNVDANDGEGGAADAGVTYSIVSNADPDGDLTGAVVINAANGEITVNDIGDFDFESAATFDVTVRADDGVKTTDRVVTVNVTDLADGDPVFTASGPFAIAENPAGGASVGNVDANDGDGGAADAGITYSIVANADPDADTSNAVSINAATGELTVNDVGDFDFENVTSFDVTVRADDGVDTTDRVMTVNVTNVDEAPIFTATGPFGIAENAAVSTVVGNVDATDGDGGAADAGITYSIVTNADPDGDTSGAFAIDAATGEITVNDPGDLDFEGANPLTVTVRADDGVNQTDTSVTVNLSDVNEAPVYTASGPFSVAENAAVSTVVGNVDANDGDGGAADAGVTYSIVSNADPDGDTSGAFVIDSATGEIRVNDPGDLDFEGTNPVLVTVRASDGVNQTDTVVAVNLTDVDESPVFTAAGPFGVAENSAVATVVGNVDANDGDGGAADAGITYSIVSNQDPDGDGTAAFAIDGGTGEITVTDSGDLDFEGANPLTITVRADDGVNVTDRAVTVNVTNADEAPVFVASGPYNIAEDSTAATVVGNVDATDGDGGAADAGVTYSIVANADPDGDTNGAFVIDAATGEITIGDPGDLDFEGTTPLTVTVRADDGVNVTDEIVTVNVTDVDESAVFESSGPYAIAENSAAGTTVGDVDANDGDGGAPDAGITYSIVANADPDGDTSGAFVIDAATGEITVNDPGDLDFEGANPLTITVRADDGVNVTDEVVTVNLSDVNEAPVFIATGPFAVAENSAAGTAVGNVDATDGDGGATDAGVAYSIVTNANPDGDASGAFAIDAATGALTVNDTGDLDFEGANPLTITVRASDGVNLTDTAVTVNLNDVDEAPIFTATGPYLVAENSAAGSAVGDVDANDGDGGATDAGVVYSIVGNQDPDGDGTGAFAIDAASGALTVADAGDIDFEGANPLVITVRADDGVNTTDESVTVKLVDVDEAPVFTATGPFTVAENSVAGTTVGNVDATDGDGGATDAGVAYSIVTNVDPDGDSNGAFTIDAATGALTVADAGDLDFEGATPLSVTVRADDGVNVTDTGITVTLSDVDEAPVFTATGPYTVAENSAAGTVVGDVDANDGDGGAADAGVTYSIVSNADPDGDSSGAFAIHSATGTISVNDSGDLDFEGTNPLHVTVRAYDGVLAVTEVVTIDLTDVNESPAIALANTPASLSETVDTTARVKVADIVVSDDALGSNALSLAGSDAALFEIDGTELFLRAGAALDHASNATLDVTVRVDDAALGSTHEDDDAAAIAVSAAPAPAATPSPGPVIDPPAPAPAPGPAPEPDPTAAPPTPDPAADEDDDAPADDPAADPVLDAVLPDVPPADESASVASSGTLVDTGVFSDRSGRAIPAVFSPTQEPGMFLRTALLRVPLEAWIGPVDPGALGGVPDARGPEDSGTRLIHAADFLRGLDDLREDVSGELRFEKATVGSAVAMSTGLSVGYVVWLIRGGVLMSSVLSSLPAWRFVDPISVLAYGARGDDEDDESLETIVESSVEETPPETGVDLPPPEPSPVGV